MVKLAEQSQWSDLIRYYGAFCFITTPLYFSAGALSQLLTELSIPGSFTLYMVGTLAIVHLWFMYSVIQERKQCTNGVYKDSIDQVRQYITDNGTHASNLQDYCPDVKPEQDVYYFNGRAIAKSSNITSDRVISYAGSVLAMSYYRFLMLTSGKYLANAISPKYGPYWLLPLVSIVSLFFLFRIYYHS